MVQALKQAVVKSAWEAGISQGIDGAAGLLQSAIADDTLVATGPKFQHRYRSDRADSQDDSESITSGASSVAADFEHINPYQ
jgi:hypothetical protein